MNNKSLAEVASDRLLKTSFGREYLKAPEQIVVFGSMSAGLDRPDSDIDVLCLSNQGFTLKTDHLDLVVVSAETLRSQVWLESELASHIAEYGTWITGSSDWRFQVHIGADAILNKRRRISAFIRALPKFWPNLQECFRVKYSLKLMRETQRLLLMERGIPVPPTRVLDNCWDSIARSSSELLDRMRDLTLLSERTFTNDLFARVERRLQCNISESVHRP